MTSNAVVSFYDPPRLKATRNEDYLSVEVSDGSVTVTLTLTRGEALHFADDLDRLAGNIREVAVGLPDTEPDR